MGTSLHTNDSVRSVKVFNVGRNMINHYRFIFLMGYFFPWEPKFSANTILISWNNMYHSRLVRHINFWKFVLHAFILLVILHPWYLGSKRKKKWQREKNTRRHFFKCRFSGGREKHSYYFLTVFLNFPELYAVKIPDRRL